MFLESTCATLGCRSEEFWSIYDSDKLAADVLSNEILTNVIAANHERLRVAEHRYRLDDLLTGMVIHAPHPLGQRYAAVSLHIAHEKGEDTVINLATAWMEQLFLPIMAISRILNTKPNSSRSPEPEAWNFRKELSKREEHRCAFTGAFDVYRRQALYEHGREAEVPDGCFYATRAATHIIPRSLNDFSGKGTDLEIGVAAYTCDLDILQSWTQIDLQPLAGSGINSASNGIFMSTMAHETFRTFQLYLDKDTYPTNPNKYRLRTIRPAILATGKEEVDIEFRSLAQSGVDPPNPALLSAHAAIAKVLNLCGAGRYVEKVERDAEDCGILREDGETDVAILLMNRLAWRHVSQV
ncbi:hypothetical protein M413DRAFT_446058 [Hebeloma cylindrosporum]|uniref:HNH nuclease domain-containing protein n=1 Tax=Hebeloma cylindrosporum TaxID=76867 RepID=A0A0C2XSF8_HEBCY|nr:hypothetical protein M413DRAFT_446058 [Hebeloma cylindrosporum h7]